jgi:hypothetical protein
MTRETSVTPDHAAAAHYRAEAEKDYQAAENSRRLGHPLNERIARELARRHDDMAYILETGREPRERRRKGVNE